MVSNAVTVTLMVGDEDRELQASAGLKPGEYGVYEVMFEIPDDVGNEESVSDVEAFIRVTSREDESVQSSSSFTIPIMRPPTDVGK